MSKLNVNVEYALRYLLEPKLDADTPRTHPPVLEMYSTWLMMHGGRGKSLTLVTQPQVFV